MWQTLVYVPIPWIVVGWIVLCLGAIGFTYAKHGIGKELYGIIPFVLFTAALGWFLLPRIVVTELESTGVPVRGYGFFLLIAVSLSVFLAAYRAERVGQSADMVYSISFAMFILGISGARAFYVIEYRELFGVTDVKSFVEAMLNMNEGGLVVYGSLIGGLIAAVGYCVWNRINMLEVADILAPSMVLGLAIGRLGCLMNGCCFGGVCDNESLAIQFPVASPAYARQLENGQMLGITSKATESKKKKTGEQSEPLVVEQVAKNSIAEQRGIVAGDKLRIFFSANQLKAAEAGLDEAFVDIQRNDSRVPIRIPFKELPKRSLGVHPTQIYSSINGFVLFAFLWFYFPFRRGFGQVFAILMMVYPITRILLEFIRTDEMGQFGTMFTISQWVSVFIFMLGVGVFIYSFNYPTDEHGIRLSTPKG